MRQSQSILRGRINLLSSFVGAHNADRPDLTRINSQRVIGKNHKISLLSYLYRPLSAIFPPLPSRVYRQCPQSLIGGDGLLCTQNVSVYRFSVDRR